MAVESSGSEQVLIEFIADTSSLDVAENKFSNLSSVDKEAADQFKKTNAELAKRQSIIDDLQKRLTSVEEQQAQTVADLQAGLDKFITNFVEGWQEGVIDALKEAGLEFDQFGKVVNTNTDNAVKKTTSLKGQLRSMREEMAQLKLEGKDSTQEYLELAQAVGRVQDALGDAAQEGKNFASDTAKIDGLISAAQGIAGGFAAAQGAVGLFGDSSDALNETLLKVNSAMAILQGLQQVGNVLQKESAAATLLTTTAQQAYNFVIGESIGLLRTFRIALAATGIGAVVAALGFLIEYLTRSSRATEQLTKDFVKFNAEAERDINTFKQYTAEGTRASEERQAALKAQGALQSDISREAIEGQKSELQGLLDLQAGMRDRYNLAVSTLTKLATGEIAYNDALAEQAQKTVDTFNDLGQKRLDVATEVRKQSIELEKQLQVEQLQAVADGINARLALTTKNSKQEYNLARESAQAQAAIALQEAGENSAKRLLIEADLQKQLRDLARQYQIVRQNDRIAATEAELTKVQKASQDINSRQSQDEINLEKKLIQQKAQLDLLQEGLTANQKTAIVQKSLADQLKLQKDFNKQSTEDALNDLISINQAQLANINLSSKEQLQLKEENLVAAAQIEIEENKGLTAKIKAIRAQLEVDIRALRLETIQNDLQKELDAEATREAALRRAADRIAANENAGLKTRLNAINIITDLDVKNVQTREDALNKELKDGLISQKDYNDQYAKLKDEETDIVQQSEAKKQKLISDTNKKSILLALDTANQVLGIIQQFGEQQTTAEEARIDAQRQNIQDLQTAGEISDKEAARRQKELDAQDAALKLKQERRNKSIAIFEAIINTAAAVTKALPNFVLAGIAAALGAAQVALIASRPLPQFGKGKKDGFEGWGEVGETGAELIEREDGSMYVAPKKTIIYIGAKDKVYTPSETKQMMKRANLEEATTLASYDVSYPIINNNSSKIDYDKLGKAISDNIPQHGLDINEKGFTTWTKRKNIFERYLNKRRSYSKK